MNYQASKNFSSVDQRINTFRSITAGLVFFWSLIALLLATKQTYLAQVIAIIMVFVTITFNRTVTLQNLYRFNRFLTLFTWLSITFIGLLSQDMTWLIAGYIIAIFITQRLHGLISSLGLTVISTASVLLINLTINDLSWITVFIQLLTGFMVVFLTSELMPESPFEGYSQNLSEQRENMLRIFISAMRDIALLIDSQGNLLAYTESYRLFLNKSDQELLGQNFYDLVAFERLDLWKKRVNRVLENGTFVQFQTQIRNGYFDVTISPIKDSAGGITHLAIFTHDVTVHRHIEEEEHRLREIAEALNQTASVLSSTLDLNHVLDLILDLIATVAEFKAAAILLVDEERARLVRSQGYDLQQTDNLIIQQSALMRHVIRHQQPLVIFDAYQAADTEPDIYLAPWVRSSLIVPIISDNMVIGFLILDHDKAQAFSAPMAKRVLAFAHHAAIAIKNASMFDQINTSHNRLRVLARKVVSAQESERQRLSRELHDQAGQALIALKISLETIRMDLPHESEHLNHRLQDAIGLTDLTMEQLRVLAHDLRPPSLDTIGLRATLENYSTNFTRRTNLNLNFECPDLDISDTVKITLYRIVQEGLTNIAKYAQASQVHIEVKSIKLEMISLTIDDDGVGVEDPSALLNGANRGIGILGMQERLELVGGSLSLSKSKLGGICIIAIVPMRVKQNHDKDQQDSFISTDLEVKGN